MTVTQHSSPAFEFVSPKLSVLVPFFRDDATALLRALDAQVEGLAIEILFYDDGTKDEGLTARMADATKQATGAFGLLTNSENQGRSGARNALFEAARADWVLFLDADMLPAKEDFLKSYLSLIEANMGDILFGGFEVEDHAEDADRDLHRALSEVSDCLTLAERQAAGPQYVASSNLCVRRIVLETEPFDSGFSGWAGKIANGLREFLSVSPSFMWTIQPYIWGLKQPIPY